MDGRNETEKMDSDFAAESFYVVMTDHKAKANLEKCSSWPPEAIPYGLSVSVALYYPNAPTPHLRPNPRPPTLHISPYQSIIK